MFPILTILFCTFWFATLVLVLWPSRYIRVAVWRWTCIFLLFTILVLFFALRRAL